MTKGTVSYGLDVLKQLCERAFFLEGVSLVLLHIRALLAIVKLHFSPCTLAYPEEQRLQAETSRGGREWSHMVENGTYSNVCGLRWAEDAIHFDLVLSFTYRS